MDIPAAPANVPATLFTGEVNIGTQTTYVENAVQMSWAYQTSLLPDNEAMAENNLSEATLMVALPAGQIVNISVFDEFGASLDSVSLTNTGSGATIWGSFTWGQANCGGKPYSVKRLINPAAKAKDAVS